MGIVGAGSPAPEAAGTGVATGVWSEDDVREMWREGARYEPEMADSARETLVEGWHEALERARGGR